MPTAQKRNDSMQQLNSVDQLRIQDRNFAAEWYDTTGDIGFTSAITLNLDAERLNTAPSVYSMSADVLTITEAGIYLFNYAVTAGHSSGSSAAVLSIFLEEDPDTTIFGLVLASIAYATKHTTGFATAANSTILRVGFDYRYRVRIARSSGSDTLLTTANSSKLSVVRLWQNG